MARFFVNSARLHLLRARDPCEARSIRAHRKLLRHSAYLPHKNISYFCGDPDIARTNISLIINKIIASQFAKNFINNSNKVMLISRYFLRLGYAGLRPLFCAEPP